MFSPSPRTEAFHMNGIAASGVTDAEWVTLCRIIDEQDDLESARAICEAAIEFVREERAG